MIVIGDDVTRGAGVTVLVALIEQAYRDWSAEERRMETRR